MGIQRKNQGFVEWIPNNFKTSIVLKPPKYTKQAAAYVANSTAMKSVFERIAGNFTKLWERKAFLHWYRQEGMDDTEFKESLANCKDLVVEYQDKEEAEMDLSNPEFDAKMAEYVSGVKTEVWDGYDGGGDWEGDWEEDSEH